MVIENPISGEVVATWPKISVEERLDVLQRQLPALDAYTTYKFLSEAERDAFWDDGPNSAITTDAKQMSLLEHSQICNYILSSSAFISFIPFEFYQKIIIYNLQTRKRFHFFIW